jgi:hypothetical protein
MSKPTSTWREPVRHPTPAEPFGGYPYLVTRIGTSALRHLLLVPADWPREKITALAREQADANRIETAACFAADDAVYVSLDGTRTWPGPTPVGIPVTGRLQPVAPITASAELDQRRTELERYVRATAPAGYLVGDGGERGEWARADDRVRLGGRQADGLPRGLRRCARCRGAAGDYLRGGAEIVRLWCACENHNLCARCQTPLGNHRLSAWFWSDDDDQAWYLAGYAAFGHRCPDGQTSSGLASDNAMEG